MYKRELILYKAFLILCNTL